MQFNISNYLEELGFKYRPFYMMGNTPVNPSQMICHTYEKNDYEISVSYLNSKHNILEVVSISFAENQKNVRRLEHMFNDSVQKLLNQHKDKLDGFNLIYNQLNLSATGVILNPLDRYPVNAELFVDTFTKLGWTL